MKSLNKTEIRIFMIFHDFIWSVFPVGGGGGEEGKQPLDFICWLDFAVRIIFSWCAQLI